MKLLDLHIDGFGKFHDLDVTFSDGLNIVYGKNEAGKSTLHTFVRCMLFGLERGRGRASKNDTYSRFEPWDGKSVYGGYLRVEQEGMWLRLEGEDALDAAADFAGSGEAAVQPEAVPALWPEEDGTEQV